MEDNRSGRLSPSLLPSQRQQHPLIGYYLSRKKLSKLRFDQFLHLCKQNHIDTIELTHDYFQYSKTNRIPQLIVHKLEDDIISRSLIEQIRLLPKPSTIILDEFDSISRLLNRYEQYTLLNSTDQDFYIVPSFVRVTDDDDEFIIEKMLMKNSITFPIMCKPIQAHGEKSHDMKIIFDNQHLHDIDKPSVLQKFIDHNAVLFKVFAIGRNNYYTVQRNSIRNLDKHLSRETIAFHSSEVSSSQADHILLSTTDRNISIDYDENKIHKIAQFVQNLFDLNLVGIDIIIDKNTDDYAVIDVNYFPGYEGVHDFSKQLFYLCRHLLHLS